MGKKNKKKQRQKKEATIIRVGVEDSHWFGKVITSLDFLPEKGAISIMGIDWQTREIMRFVASLDMLTEEPDDGLLHQVVRHFGGQEPSDELWYEMCHRDRGMPGGSQEFLEQHFGSLKEFLEVWDIRRIVDCHTRLDEAEIRQWTPDTIVGDELIQDACWCLCCFLSGSEDDAGAYAGDCLPVAVCPTLGAMVSRFNWFRGKEDD